jgi:hypothetical protein
VPIECNDRIHSTKQQYAAIFGDYLFETYLFVLRNGVYIPRILRSLKWCHLILMIFPVHISKSAHCLNDDIKGIGSSNV